MGIKNTAIVLAAGRGSRMKSQVQKQYLLIKEKPVLYYSLKQFEECPFIHEIILVTGKDEMDYCREEFLDKYRFKKISKIIQGGSQRYDSVYEGLKAADTCTYIFIHDGARPFLDQDILKRAYDSVKKNNACAVGMPVKDTIKISNEEGFCQNTPRRDLVWMIQTPQVFRFDSIKSAYDKIMKRSDLNITDDAMVMETEGDWKVKLVLGSYTNIKITTPEDLSIADILCP